MPNIGELLRFHNIVIKDTAPGRYYTTCPHCSASRKPPHRKLKCLGVTIREDRAYWGCNHCGITGPEKAPPQFTYANGFKTKSEGEGRFFWRKDDESDPGPFRINEALESDGVILIAEGEKDVNTLWALGFPATCGPHGANTWKAEYSERLKARDIVVMNDNDVAGYKYAKLVVDCSLGVARSVRRLDLKEFWPEIGEGEDVSDWIDHGGGSTAWLETILADLPLINGHDEHKPAAPYAWLDTSPWSRSPPPAPRWVVQDILPRGEVCLFSGSGGTGKSTIALHLAAACALGLAWLSYPVAQGPAMFIDAEDATEVIWRRTDKLAGNYGCGIADITDQLHILSLKGQDALLATFSKNGAIVPTPLLDWIRREAARIKPVVIVIASSANVFAGNENDRSHTTQFASGLLGGLALAADACVMLIAHPPKNTGSDYSGSTAWHAAVRARMSLDKPGENGSSNGIRQLVFPKNQYGPDHDPLTLEWRNGLFLPPPGVGSYEQAAKDQKVDELFMTLLRKLLSTGAKLSPDQFSRTYAPNVMAKMDEANGTQKHELKAAMERAEQRGTIQFVTMGNGARERTYVAFANV